MKVLFLSNLYPNLLEPTRAVYNKQKIDYLKKYCEITVVAPVFWFPFKSLFLGTTGNIPFKETIDGLVVYHPKIFYIPKLFRIAYGFFYYLSIRSLMKDLFDKIDFDVIYSSWLYPDSFAAMKLAEVYHKPLQVEALGSDINIHCKSILRRRLIIGILKKACNIVVISEDLKEKLVRLKIPLEKIRVIYIGVDHTKFYPIEKNEARKRLGLPEKEKIILFIGNLIKIKGIGYLLEAFKLLKDSDIKFYIIGKGNLENSLQKMIGRLGLQNKVVMLGSCAHELVPLWMNASELVCVPSIMEGQPNVILEALACGIPVVASRLGGIPELVTDKKQGILTQPADAVSLKSALAEALSSTWDRGYISKSVTSFSWEDNAAKRFEFLKFCVK